MRTVTIAAERRSFASSKPLDVALRSTESKLSHPDPAAYVPATVLIDERPHGVHLSFDTFVSLLTPYENAEASELAAKLDALIGSLLTNAL